jgi:hypothetical protein
MTSSVVTTCCYSITCLYSAEWAMSMWHMSRDLATDSCHTKQEPCSNADNALQYNFLRSKIIDTKWDSQSNYFKNVQWIENHKLIRMTDPYILLPFHAISETNLFVTIKHRTIQAHCPVELHTYSFFTMALGRASGQDLALVTFTQGKSWAGPTTSLDNRIIAGEKNIFWTTAWHDSFSYLRSLSKHKKVEKWECIR